MNSMRPDDPRHGEYRGAVAHYKAKDPLCDPCREAHRRYNRRNKKRTRRGDIMHIPANIVQKRLSALRADGMSLLYIADRAGCSKSTIDNIVNGRRNRVTNRVAIAIAQVEHHADGLERVAAWRLERRLQSLYALGWTLAEMSRRSGWSSQNLNALMYPRWRHRQTVQADTFYAIDELFTSLCMTTPPPSAGALVAKRRAAERGWAPPLAYDDIDRDTTPRTPDARPELVDEATILRVLAGETLPTNRAEKTEIMRRWLASGRSERSLCETQGWKAGRYITHEEGAA